ncbi:hypothetical protein [Psychroserpens luteus]|uniref:Uncharacterized protein n=1 Tax=Psychroserpens luteus TaxID=1434066 RepID=A0ABW5ZYK6_9FLAO|nr:hypothetical protein [Psychroserpens luteus]
MIWFKVKAGALQMTLFIGVIIALILTAFILLVHIHNRFKIQANFIIETTKNADNGIHYALNNNISLNDTTSVSLIDEDYKSLKLNRDFWGVFERVTSVSKIKNNRIEKSALIGGLSIYNQRLALYVQDNNKPLVLVGKTRIEGLTYLPKRGVKSGTISGESYYGTQLIYGSQRTARALPKIISETVTQIQSIEKTISNIKENQYLNIREGGVYKNSFFKPTLILFSNSEINLNAITLIGNIIIQSKRKIVVESSSVLRDVILIAPEVEIQNDVKGNLQAFASEELLLGERIILDYPSAIILNEKTDATNSKIKNSKHLVIGSNSKIKGLVLFLGQTKPNNYDVQLELKENASITGEVYCNQNFELKGTVLGSVYTNNFIARQFGSVYQNHIYYGKIIANDLPKEYVGLSFGNSKKGVIKWLY